MIEIIRHIYKSLRNLARLYQIITMTFACLPVIICGQGIQFTGGNQPIEKRTSAVFFSNDPPTFDGQFAIDFDLQLPSNHTIGYILRIKEENQASIFNLYYEEKDGEAMFVLNEEGKASLITIRVQMRTLKKQHWFPIHIDFDLHNGFIKLQVADQPAQSAKAPLRSPYSPLITFGRSDYMIDVPSFALRNLHIGNNKKSISFPLKESSGHTLHDVSGKAMGKLTNGTWLLNNAFHWQTHVSMYSSSHAGSQYNPKTKSIYYFNKDSLYIYNIQTNETQTIKFQYPCPLKLKLGQSFIDTAQNRLYVYETFHVTPYHGPTVASLNLEDFTWQIESSDYLNRELNHHGSYYAGDERKFLIFGGFGNMSYSNEMLYYDLEQKKWSKPMDMQGDRIFPRYFTSMGYASANRKIYIFGGMGNESGQHIVGRKYFYDLYAFDPKTRKTKKLWELNWKKSPFVPARNLVIPDSAWVYLLGYPEHLTRSHIKLRRFSIKDGQYEELGDSIPIYSDRISTRAELHFDPYLKKLIAIVQESDDDIRSKLTVYSLDFPPISENQLHAFPGERQQSHQTILYTFGASILCIALFLSLYYWQKTKDKGGIAIKSTEKPEILEQIANRIYLFGDFTVFDRHGRDISHLFSTRLQQVYCLILFHSHTVGISSNLLSHLLWPDKPKDKVKISRGVAINNLRKVLSELDAIEIVYEDGHYRILFQEVCYCDYWELKAWLTKPSDFISPQILTILQRGEFLLGMDDPLFDNIKTEIENMLVDRLQQSMEKCLEQRDWSTLLKVANTLLTIDSINETALENGLYALYKRKQESRSAEFYKRFTENYSRLMGEDYKQSFDDLWRRVSQ